MKQMNFSTPLALLLVTICTVFTPSLARGDDDPSFKLSTGVYSMTGGGLPSASGVDLNLRHSSNFGNVWIGEYRSHDQHTSQWRTGWDRTFKLEGVRLQPSLQAAQGGFFGGSFYAEAGEDWFAGLGIGRTNLRPYANLNFDPNDSWTLSGGRHFSDGQVLTLLLIGDNRQNSDQRHLHFLYRTPLTDGRRLTVDLLAKRGLVAGTLIHKAGLSVAYDWPRYFVRIAFDPKANFAPQDMWRLTGGVRF